jgi:hypothetical protein
MQSCGSADSPQVFIFNGSVMSFRQILNSPIFLVFMVTLAGAATTWHYIARQEGWNRMEKQQRIETDVKTSIEKT